MWRKQIRAEQKQKALKSSSSSSSSSSKDEQEQETDAQLIDLTPSHPSKVPGGTSIVDSEVPTPKLVDTPLAGGSMVSIPSAQNTGGAAPVAMESEITPKTAAAERLEVDSPGRKGKGKERQGVRRSVSGVSGTSGISGTSGVSGTSSVGGPGNPQHGKWSARGLRKALSLKGTMARRRSVSRGGTGGEGSDRDGGRRRDARTGI
jgi:ATP-binding cassette, subfamily B, vacuolar membrane transporter HMT1/ACLQ